MENGIRLSMTDPRRPSGLRSPLATAIMLGAVIGGSVATAQQVITCEVNSSTNVCLQSGSNFDGARECPRPGESPLPCPDEQVANPQDCPITVPAQQGQQGRTEASPLTRNCEFTQKACADGNCITLTPSVSSPVVCYAISGSSCTGTGPGGGGGGGGPPSELPPEE